LQKRIEGKKVKKVVVTIMVCFLIFENLIVMITFLIKL